MKWVTRKRIHVNRTATAWLIRRLVDPNADIEFVEANEVAAVQQRENAIGFDAPGARYPHQDERGRCSFEQLVDEHFPHDPALQRLALIVHGADFPTEIDITPESAGLWAISQGFGDEVAKDDAEIVERASFIYDSLLVYLRSVSHQRSP
jgi:hypothetical protein